MSEYPRIDESHIAMTHTLFGITQDQYSLQELKTHLENEAQLSIDLCESFQETLDENKKLSKALTYIK